MIKYCMRTKYVLCVISNHAVVCYAKLCKKCEIFLYIFRIYNMLTLISLCKTKELKMVFPSQNVIKSIILKG